MSHLNYIGFGKYVNGKVKDDNSLPQMRVAKIITSSYYQPITRGGYARPKKENKKVGFGRQPTRYYGNRKRQIFIPNHDNELEQVPTTVSKATLPTNVGFGKQVNRHTFEKSMRRPRERVFTGINKRAMRIAQSRFVQNSRFVPQNEIPNGEGEGGSDCECDCLCIDGNLIGNVCGDLFGNVFGGNICGDIFTNCITAKDNGNIKIIANIEQKGDIFPTINNKFNLGNTDSKWANFYTENAIICGDTDLGDNINEDTVTFMAKVDSDIFPSVTNTHDLGSESLKWATVYTNDLIVCANAEITEKLTTNCINANVINSDIFGNVCGDVVTDNISAKNDGNIVIVANIEQEGDIKPTINNKYLLGDPSLKWAHIYTEDLTVCGDTDLGDNINEDTVTFMAKVDSDILPETDDTHDLGSETLKWATVYTNDLVVCANADITDKLTANCINANTINSEVFGNVCGDITTDNIVAKNDGNINIVANINQEGDIIPTEDQKYDLGNIDFKWANLFTQDATVCGDLCVVGMIKGNIEVEEGNITNVIADIICANLIKGDLEGNVCGDIVTDNISAKNNGNITVVANIEQEGDIIPTINNKYDLGDPSLKWAHIYTEDLTVCGDTDLGDAPTDTVTFTARVDSDVLPNTNNTHDLGSDSLKWATVYTQDLVVCGEANIVEQVITNNVLSNLVCTQNIQVDYIDEKTPDHGVIIDGVINKDNMVTADKITANTKVVTDLLEAQDTGTIEVDGNLVPLNDDEFTLGTISKKWAEVFTNDLTVCQNATIQGNLTILGNTTTVGSNTIVVDDPCFVINNDPNMSHDPGYLMQRFQTANDTLEGDVIDGPSVQTANVAASTASTVTLDAGLASGDDDRYNNWWISITAGNGIQQVRKIVDYNGTTKVATLGSNWTTNPDTSSIYKLHPCNFVGMIWDETQDKIVIACTANANCAPMQIEDILNLCAADIESENIMPSQDLTFELGGPSAKWAKIYTQDLIVCGNSDLGDNINEDTVTFNAKVDSDILPETNNTYDLGSLALKWAHVYTQDLTVCNNADITDKLTANCINSNVVNSDVFGNVCGDIETDNISAKNDGNITILANINQEGDIIPTEDNKYILGNADFKWANIFTQDAVICGDLCVEGMIKGNIDVPIGNISNIITDIICANTIKGDLIGNVCGDIETDNISAKNDGNIKITANVEQQGNIKPTVNNKYFLGDPTLKWAHIYTEDLTVCGDTDLGDAPTDTVTFTARVDSDILPSSNNSFDLGSLALKWATIYTNDLVVCSNANITEKITANCINSNVVNSDVFGNLCGDISTDLISAKNDGNILIQANIEQEGDIIPTEDRKYDLGNIDLKWNHIYTDDMTVCGTLCITGTIKGNIDVDVGNLSNVDANLVCANVISTNCIIAKHPEQPIIVKGNVEIEGDLCAERIVTKTRFCADFEEFEAGDTPTELENIILSLTGQAPGHGPLMIFDSSNPTGGDSDLGSPNHTCPGGGPGVGTGGEVGMPGENCEALGKILIISQDGNSNDPNDSDSGGMIDFTFDCPVQIEEVWLMDIDTTETADIKLYDAEMNMIGSPINSGSLGNNSLEKISVMVEDVKLMRITMSSSGAIAKVLYNKCVPKFIGDLQGNICGNTCVEENLTVKGNIKANKCIQICNPNGDTWKLCVNSFGNFEIRCCVDDEEDIVIKKFTCNPCITEETDLNILVIVDCSGSIVSGPNGNDNPALITFGLKKLVDSYSFTQSKIAVMKFCGPSNSGTNGSINDAQWVTDVGGDYYRSAQFEQATLETEIDGALGDVGDYSGFTNWHAAFVRAKELSPRPDAIVFITDGNPNVKIGVTPDASKAQCYADSAVEVSNEDFMNTSTATNIVSILVGAVNEQFVANIIPPLPGSCDNTYSTDNSAYLLSGNPPAEGSEFFKVTTFTEFEDAIATLIQSGTGLCDTDNNGGTDDEDNCRTVYLDSANGLTDLILTSDDTVFVCATGNDPTCLTLPDATDVKCKKFTIRSICGGEEDTMVVDCDGDKFTMFRFQFQPTACPADQNDYPSGLRECDDFDVSSLLAATNADITVYKSGDIYFDSITGVGHAATPVNVNEVFDVFSITAGDDNFGGDITIDIIDPTNPHTVWQRIKMHVSCSDDLILNELYGSSKLKAVDFKNSGLREAEGGPCILLKTINGQLLNHVDYSGNVGYNLAGNCSLTVQSDDCDQNVGKWWIINKQRF